MVRLVIFDLDGVITNTSYFHFLAWKQLANELNIKFDNAINESLKGLSRMDSLERILEYNNINAKFTPAEKEELANRKNTYYVNMLEKLNRANIMPGIEEFLEELKREKVYTALASASRNATFILDKLGLIDRFNYVVNPKEVARGKPFPDIFLKAAVELGVHPYECVGIEDSEAGINSIKSAGMFSVGIGEKKSLHKADLVLKSTSELRFKTIKSFYENWRTIKYSVLNLSI
ncbi:beta-phosphoglucomutase [Caldicoprobacter algeriensis]|uniref:beta-phosphoglucomutase n=1 Tax=Caldicoprobacter algeriensis TaxID=699281 RepID=UPI00207B0093|nr:beta-phosphoglucomutase [Caldicoprobacter algeriensis]